MGACNSKGGAGEKPPFGEGMESGSAPSVNVKSSHPLTDYIGRGGTGFANEIMGVRDSMEQAYGDAVKGIALHVGTFDKAGTLGAYGGNTLYMNEKYVTNANLTEAMKNAGTYHPSIGNRTGAEAVAAHEIGHRLGEVAARKAGISERDIVERAAKTIGIKTNNMAGYISGYARTAYGETIAEACSDVFCNGSKASKASIAISNEIKKILGKGK